MSKVTRVGSQATSHPGSAGPLVVVDLVLNWFLGLLSFRLIFLAYFSVLSFFSLPLRLCLSISFLPLISRFSPFSLYFPAINNQSTHHGYRPQCCPPPGAPDAP